VKKIQCALLFLSLLLTAPGYGQPAADAMAAGRYKEIYDQIQIAYYDSEGMALAARKIGELHAESPNSPYTKLAMAEYLFAQAVMSGGAGLEEVERLAIQGMAAAADSFILRAKINVLRGQAHWALLYAGNAVRLAPEKPEAHFAMGRAQQASGNAVEAARWLTRAADGMSDPRRKSNVYYWLGRAFVDENLPHLVRTRHLADAREAFRKSAELNPRAQSLNNYGWFLVHYGADPAEAEKVLTKALEIGAARRNLAVVRYAQWGTNYLAGKSRDKADSIARRTGLGTDEAFVTSAQYPALAAVPRALLKSGDIGDVDVIPAGHACRCTALVKAAHGGHAELVRELVEAGANVNAADRSQTTPLMYAVMRQDAAMASLLLSRGARPNVLNAENMTALEPAIALGAGALPAFHVLLQHNADPRAADREGNPLTFVAAKSGNLDAMRILIEKYGLDPNAKSISGTPLVGAAAFAGMEEGVKFLLHAGANPWVFYDKDNIVERLDSMKQHGSMAARRASLERIRDILAEAQKKTPRP
jgi:tetratricopeptide (TPR) repeat protein